MAREQRFNREAVKPVLAEAPREDAELETAELLDRLERQAADAGRLEASARTFEEAATAEREARRRLASMLQKERKAAAAIHARAEREHEARVAGEQELERLRDGLALAEQHLQRTWQELTALQGQLTWAQRPLWRKLLRRPPRAGA